MKTTISEALATVACILCLLAVYGWACERDEAARQETLRVQAERITVTCLNGGGLVMEPKRVMICQKAMEIGL